MARLTAAFEELDEAYERALAARDADDQSRLN
jgi:hypothetical protein